MSHWGDMLKQLRIRRGEDPETGKLAAEYLQLEKKPLHTKGIPKEEIQAGQKVEKEHTECPRIAKQIAVDHLHEGTNYYQLLENMETKLKKKADISAELDTLQKIQAMKPKIKKPKALRIKSAFEEGFIKRAMECGLTAGEAMDVLKQAADEQEKKADSSSIGRYFAEKAVPSSAFLDHPWKATGEQR